MPSAEYDLGYLRGGISALESYLLSNDLYWPIGAGSPSGEPPYPRLTLGGLMLAQKRAHARDLKLEQRDELARLDEQMDDVRDRWQVTWERKAGRSFQARLRLWNNFLEDYRESPSANADRYRYEAERRVMLHLLMDEAEIIAEADMELLEVLDKVVRSALVPGDFIWDAGLESGFPREPYWYLYGQLKA
jgi:hypothetical protein